MRGAPLHGATLVGSLGVVGDEVGIEVGLHLLDGLVPLLAAHDSEVFVEHGAAQALDQAVGLRAFDPASASPMSLAARGSAVTSGTSWPL